MRDLWRVCSHLDLDSAKLVATALVSSRLDNCNSLLYGITDIDLTRYQCVPKDNSLSVRKVKTNTGARAFHSCAPSLWNNLPLSVRSAITVATFKKHLKTNLFDLAFPHRYRHAPWPVDVTELLL